jgi:hypothetical protein
MLGEGKDEDGVRWLRTGEDDDDGRVLGEAFTATPFLHSHLFALPHHFTNSSILPCYLLDSTCTRSQVKLTWYGDRRGLTSANSNGQTRMRNSRSGPKLRVLDPGSSSSIILISLP